jgi:hypothetical protein
MGTGASIEEGEPQRRNDNRFTERDNHSRAATATPYRQSLQSLQSRGSSWKDLIREIKLSDVDKRKLRASLLGNHAIVLSKVLCKIEIK